MTVENVYYDCYADHRETILFDEIVLYSRWLAASSTIIVRYLPERVVRQFDYQHTIPRQPSDSALIAMTRRRLDEVFANWDHHMVPAEARATTSERDWSCVDGYITSYYRVSHLYMLPTAPRSPPRPAHKEIL
ncbi:uncharacterized protein LOC131634468 [Vicia villosa]|uniref:uncharacterized protein LOC131634468 n=1 Tax=Vicia villosa TaxID=3911 RepID=UPI00273AECE6|nr:uncharacterized protein LOC131634468 [Vicia villosa]